MVLLFSVMVLYITKGTREGKIRNIIDSSYFMSREFQIFSTRPDKQSTNSSGITLFSPGFCVGAKSGYLEPVIFRYTRLPEKKQKGGEKNEKGI